MTYLTGNVLWVFHPRPLTDGERQVLRDWAAATRFISASVNERLRQDPSTYRRISVAGRTSKRPLYFIYSHRNTTTWVLVSAVEREEVGRFASLADALNCISPAPPAPSVVPSPAVAGVSNRVASRST